MDSKYVDLTKKESVFSKTGDILTKGLVIVCSVAVLYGIIAMTADDSVEREIRIEQSQR